MVSVLDRKLLRDLMRLKGQALTIALVVAVGVANYITLRSAWRALGDSKAAYYEQYRFADVFARLKRAPDSVAVRLGDVRGVASVYPRIVEEVLLPIDGMLTPAHGQIISLPSHGRPPMNDVYVKSGRFPEPGRGNEVLIYEPFAHEHELRPGSTVPAILNGKLHELIVVGLALSPSTCLRSNLAASPRMTSVSPRCGCRVPLLRRRFKWREHSTMSPFAWSRAPTSRPCSSRSIESSSLTEA